MLALNFLHRLTYVSTVAEPMDDCAISQLVNQARENNADLKITGILLYNGLNFLQTLEGPHRDVIDLFSKIAADPRHNGVVCVQSDTPDQRAFEGWTMAYSPVGRAGMEATALGSNGFQWSNGHIALPGHLQSLYMAFNSLGRGLAVAAGE